MIVAETHEYDRDTSQFRIGSDVEDFMDKTNADKIRMTLEVVYR